MRCGQVLRIFCPTARLLRGLALFVALVQASLGGSQLAAALTNQVVLFTGFLAGSGPGTGMGLLNESLAAAGIPNYLGQVFEWTQREQARRWIEQQANDRATLVLVGHSFGGSTALQVAHDELKPLGIRVDLTIQLDSVRNLIDGAANNVLPTNVDVGINYYQISTGLLEPQGEDFVSGAANFNVETVFGDTTITHTSIDDDPRMHYLIGLNIRDNLNPISGDFDFDGDVDGRDFLAWQRGGSPVPFSTGYLAQWQSEYEEASLTATSTAVPEPSALVLLGLAVPLARENRFRANACLRKA